MAGMKGLKKKRRVQIILVAFLALAGSTALIGYAMRDGINFFRSPTQVAAETPPENETFRIGGLVEKGTLKRGEGATVSFAVTDGGASVPVAYTGVLPDLFVGSCWCHPFPVEAAGPLTRLIGVCSESLWLDAIVPSP